MRRALALALALSLTGCLTAPTHEEGQYPLSRIEVERAIPTDDPAERTYRINCLPCHGVDGRGAGAVTGADFTSATDGPLRRPDDELLPSIRDGRRGTIGTMPAHREILTDAEIALVLAYVRHTFGPDIVPVATPIDADAALDAGPDAGVPSAP